MNCCTRPVPIKFVCPITEQIIRDPVRAPCGHVFDRTSIPTRKICPIDFGFLRESEMTADVILAGQISDYIRTKDRLCTSCKLNRSCNCLIL